MKFIKQNYVLILVFFLIIFLRFWKVAELFNFTFSEEMQAVMAWEQVKNFHPIWIGVGAANINYYLGPGFTYLNALLFLFLKGDPITLAFFSAFLGVVSAASLYYIVSQIFSRRVALFSTIIYGCSMLINLHDRRFWNPTPIPFITLWLLFSLYKANSNTKWYILTAILIGAIFHTHLSLLLLLVPTFFSLVKNFRKIALSTWILSIACYLIVTSPLIIFDSVHNFDNLLMPYRTITGKKKADLNKFSVQNTVSHINEVSSALGRIWFIRLNTNPQDEVILESHMDKTLGNKALSLLSIAFLGWFLWKKTLTKDHWVFSVALITIMGAFILYPSYNPEYYLMSFITLMAIVIGYGLSSIQKQLAMGIVGLFIATNIASTVTLSDVYGLTVRKKLVQKSMIAIKNQSFSLETEGALPSKQFAYAGWRYLFKAYGATPSQSSVDSVLSWIYPDEVSADKPKLHVIISDSKVMTFSKKPIASFRVRDYYSYILEN